MGNECNECGRVFDMKNYEDSKAWYFGHYCGETTPDYKNIALKSAEAYYQRRKG